MRTARPAWKTARPPRLGHGVTCPTRLAPHGCLLGGPGHRGARGAFPRSQPQRPPHQAGNRAPGGSGRSWTLWGGPRRRRTGAGVRGTVGWGGGWRAGCAPNCWKVPRGRRPPQLKSPQIHGAVKAAPHVGGNGGHTRPRGPLRSRTGDQRPRRGTGGRQARPGPPDGAGHGGRWLFPPGPGGGACPRVCTGVCRTLRVSSIRIPPGSAAWAGDPGDPPFRRETRAVVVAGVLTGVGAGPRGGGWCQGAHADFSC